MRLSAACGAFSIGAVGSTVGWFECLAAVAAGVAWASALGRRVR